LSLSLELRLCASTPNNKRAATDRESASCAIEIGKLAFRPMPEKPHRQGMHAESYWHMAQAKQTGVIYPRTKIAVLPLFKHGDRG
jgi:hypothetical protein